MSAHRLTLKLLVLTLGCYGVYYGWSPGDESVIELTPSILSQLAERHEELFERPMTEAERNQAEASYIDDEILVREAFRRGLDRADRSIRSLLIDHASRELLRVAEYQRPAPSERELQLYFDAHTERYRIPERVDVHQVFFSAGDAPEALDDILSALRGGADFKSMGSAGAGADVREASRSRFALAFGLDVTRDVFVVSEGEWHGPFTSPSGTHFFRIVKRWPGRDRSYEDVKEYVAQDFVHDDEMRALEIELARIRSRYRVDIEDVD